MKLTPFSLLKKAITGVFYSLRKDRNTTISLILQKQSLLTCGISSATIDDSADITTEIESDAARRRTEQRLSLVIDALQDGVWDFDIAAGNGYVSPRYHTMLGLPARESTTYAEFIAMLHPDDRPRVEAEEPAEPARLV